MIAINQTPIWMCTNPIDFRCQIDGLLVIVAAQLKEDPVSGLLFIFFNRDLSKIKVLFWDRNGFCLLYKRLEKGRFQFNISAQQKVAISREAFQCLLAGMDIAQLPAIKTISASCFY
jgi:transposase